ncbi:hypothetical protein [Mesorhizobium sp. ORM16]|uniref:hypothetical protein n=1 Tax=Mesorhizobium sp. ORM16 TaxID=3376989 RepID=UPI0038576D5F
MSISDRWGTKRIDRLRLLPDQKNARLQDHRRCLLFSGFERDETHGPAGGGFADRLLIGGTTLAALYEWLDIDRRDQPYVVPECRDPAGAMMRSATGPASIATRHGGVLSKSRSTSARRRLLFKIDFLPGSAP